MAGKDDRDRAAILARRSRWVRLAVAGVASTTTACFGPCLSALPRDSGVDAGPDAGDAGTDGGPRDASVDASAPVDADADTTANDGAVDAASADDADVDAP